MFSFFAIFWINKLIIVSCVPLIRLPDARLKFECNVFIFECGFLFKIQQIFEIPIFIQQPNSEEAAHLNSPNRVPRTKTVPSSWGAKACQKWVLPPIVLGPMKRLLRCKRPFSNGQCWRINEMTNLHATSHRLSLNSASKQGHFKPHIVVQWILYNGIIIILPQNIFEKKWSAVS